MARPIFLIALFFGVAAVCIATSMVTIHVTFSDKYRSEVAETKAFGRLVARRIAVTFTDMTESLADLNGAIHGTKAVVPTVPDSATMRLSDDVMAFLWSLNNSSRVGLNAIAFASNDTIDQVYPPNVSIANNHLEPPSDFLAAMLDDANSRLYGPARGVGTGYMMLAASPIYNLSIVDGLPNKRNFYWGYVAALIDVETLLNGLRDLARHEGHSFWLVADIPGTDTSYVLFNSSAARAFDVAAADETFDVTTVHYSGSSKLRWQVYVKRLDAFTVVRDSRAYAAAILGSLVAAVLTVVVTAIAHTIWTGRSKSRNSYAPMQTPFAIVVAEIEDSAVVWASAPAAVSEMIVKSTSACRKEAERAGAYPSQLIGDGMMVVARTPSAAISYARAIVKWAATEEWPEIVKQNCPKARPFGFRVSVHWCRDAKIRAVVEDCPEYTGPDVDLAVEMRSFCPFRRVTVTPQLRTAAIDEGMAPGAFYPLGTTIPSTDGAVYAGYVLLDENESHHERPDLSRSDLELWNAVDKGDMLAVASNAENRQKAGSKAQQDAEMKPRRMGAGRSAPSSKQHLGVAARAAFQLTAHASWLPARACDATDVQRLHQILQDHISTPHEAGNYSALLTVASYFYQAYNFMLGPLAVPEQKNIMRRLQVAFGVPERGFVYRLAVQCAFVAFRSLPVVPKGPGAPGSNGGAGSNGDGDDDPPPPPEQIPHSKAPRFLSPDM
jgi:class 3 adenylate cyclase